ncbi:MAG: DUF4349 domain-containing protein [Patescibacteria group bacterium]
MKKLNNKLVKPALAISLTIIVLAAGVAAMPKMRSTDNVSFLPGIMMDSDSTKAGGANGEVRLGYAEESMLAADSYYMPSPTPPTGYGGQTAAEAEQRIIKTADLALGVDGVADKTQAIATLATGKGGFVQSSTITEDTDGYKHGYITVRVPSDTFEASVDEIKNLAVRVDRESINGTDVTEQYTDLEARLRSAKAQEEQYLLILTKAVTVQDILSVQSYLQNIRYEIESLQGQLDSLGNQTNYSTISVSLEEEVRVQVPTGKFDLGRDIKLALKYVVLLAQTALTYIVWLAIVGGAVILPLGLITALIVWVVRKIVARL